MKNKEHDQCPSGYRSNEWMGGKRKRDTHPLIYMGWLSLRDRRELVHPSMPVYLLAYIYVATELLRVLGV